MKLQELNNPEFLSSTRETETLNSNESDSFSQFSMGNLLGRRMTGEFKDRSQVLKINIKDLETVFNTKEKSVTYGEIFDFIQSDRDLIMFALCGKRPLKVSNLN